LDSLFVRLSIVGQEGRGVKQKVIGKFYLLVTVAVDTERSQSVVTAEVAPRLQFITAWRKEIMKRFSNWSSLCLLGGLMLTTAVTRANADAWNKKTYVTITRSIEVPGAVLEPGKYVFKLVDSASNRHIVQILNGDENRVIATNLAIPKQRETPADQTVLTFYEMPGGGPEPVRAWFYPGDTIGQEFLYSKGRAAQIAQASRMDVPVVAQSQPEPIAVAAATIPATAPDHDAETEAATPAPFVEAAPVAEIEDQAAPAPARSTDQAPAAAPAPAEPAMPRTASSLFAAGLVGLSCVGIAAALRGATQRGNS
jgi:hypothetical protein